MTYVFLRWILKGSVCKTIQLCKKSVNRGGLGEAHVDIIIIIIPIIINITYYKIVDNI